MDFRHRRARGRTSALSADFWISEVSVGSRDLDPDRLSCLPGELMDLAFSPMCASLQPEDRGDDCLTSFTGRFLEEVLCDPGIRLDGSCIEFEAVKLTQRLNIDRNHLGDVCFRNPKASHRFQLSAVE